MLKHLMALLAFCLVTETFHAAGHYDTTQKTLSERVRSLRVHSVTDNLTTGIPVLVLGTGDAVEIEFDMLDDERRYLRYEIFHCNADWQPSTLSYLEYLDGFNEGTIDDYEYSGPTTVAYIHYRLILPNQDFQFKISGNYMVRIYDENDPEHTLIRARFSVSEQSAPISVFVTSRTDIDFNREHQQLEITVDCERAPVADLFSDAIVTVTQNGRSDAVRYIPHPLRISGRRMIFEHQPELIFEGGNEYRRFETVSNYLPGMNVDRVVYQAPYYHHYILTDKPRSASEYLYDQTLHGGYVVREYNSNYSDTEADYVVVHFSLEMPELFSEEIYIDSDAFDRVLGQESQMKYNRETGRYEKAALLKQGAYSYQYIGVPAGTSVGRTATVEGNKYQTTNQYTVNVYTRRPGERYDRMIGHATVFTGN